MLTEVLLSLFKRDLEKLKEEINLYKTESNLWILEEGISNSSGNLCLHLVGNLNHFIGEGLGNTGYVRQRELEFSLKDVPKSQLIAQVDDTIAMVEEVLGKLSNDDLQLEIT